MISPPSDRLRPAACLMTSAAIRAARLPAAAPPIPSQTSSKMPCFERDLRPVHGSLRSPYTQVGDDEGVLIFGARSTNIRGPTNRQTMVGPPTDTPN